tara:strand:+ start:82 stop:492 length:411 start_codon:yes stop_codon:yes gene_type:complete
MIKIYQKKYQQSPKGKKSYKIASWKSQGIISADWGLLYETFINTTHCELCAIELIEGKKTNSRCLDHDHNIKDDDNVRYILCHKCNNTHDRKPMDLVNRRDYNRRYKKQKRKYESSWGGDKRSQNNLLMIDPNLFF